VKIGNYCHQIAAITGSSILDIQFTRKEIRDALLSDHVALRRSIEALLEREYIQITRGGIRSRHYYSLISLNN
jgi:hypothetical protein